MKTYGEHLYWRSNPEWWTVYKGRFVLTAKAPDEARRSFALFKRESKRAQKKLAQKDPGANPGSKPTC